MSNQVEHYSAVPYIKTPAKEESSDSAEICQSLLAGVIK